MISSVSCMKVCLTVEVANLCMVRDASGAAGMVVVMHALMTIGTCLVSVLQSLGEYRPKIYKSLFSNI